MQGQNQVTNDLNTNDELMTFRGLTKSFAGQSILQEVSGTIRRGQVILLEGTNGSGKTTLLNILTGNLEPDSGNIELRTKEKPIQFKFPTQAWKKVSPTNRFSPDTFAQNGVTKTWQDVRLFSSQSLIDNLAVAFPRQLGENPLLSIFSRFAIYKQEEKNLEKSRAILKELGLEDHEKSSADKISLGQSKRISIARSVLSGAEVIFLDEPLAGLDRDGITDIIDFLRKLVEEAGLTLVIVEHIFNIGYVKQLVNTVWTLSSGKLIVKESISPDSSPTNVSAISNSLDEWLLQEREMFQKLNHYSLGGGATISIFNKDTNLGEVVLEIENLVVFRGSRPVMGVQAHQEGISFKLHRGQLAILKAPNGWGKTSFFEAIAGLIPIQEGIIKLSGRVLNTLPSWSRVELGLNFLQSRNNTFSNLTVKESLQLSQIPNIPLNIEPFLDRQVSSLSGGERQQLAFATIDFSNCVLGLFDEPFSALDNTSIENLKISLLKQVNSSPIIIAIPSNFNEIVTPNVEFDATIELSQMCGEA